MSIDKALIKEFEETKNKVMKKLPEGKFLQLYLAEKKEGYIFNEGIYMTKDGHISVNYGVTQNNTQNMTIENLKKEYHWFNESEDTNTIMSEVIKVMNDYLTRPIKEDTSTPSSSNFKLFPEKYYRQN